MTGMAKVVQNHQTITQNHEKTPDIIKKKHKKSSTNHQNHQQITKIINKSPKSSTNHQKSPKHSPKSGNILKHHLILRMSGSARSSSQPMPWEAMRIVSVRIRLLQTP